MNTSRTILGVYGSNTPVTLQTYVINVGTSPTPLVPTIPISFNPIPRMRSSLIFHNPGTIDVFIAMGTDLNGNPITPTVRGPGTIIVMQGATFQFDSPGNQAWNAVAASAAVLTVLEYLA